MNNNLLIFGLVLFFDTVTSRDSGNSFIEAHKEFNFNNAAKPMIVGGTPVMNGDERYPWFVGLGSCAGSLIAPDWGTLLCFDIILILPST